MLIPLPSLSSVTFSLSAVLYLHQLHDENERLRGFHQLIKLWESGGVIVEQVSHTAHVLLAFQGVFPLSDQPHSLGDDGVQARVLQKKTKCPNYDAIKSGIYNDFVHF